MPNTNIESLESHVLPENVPDPRLSLEALRQHVATAPTAAPVMTPTDAIQSVLQDPTLSPEAFTAVVPEQQPTIEQTPPK